MTKNELPEGTLVMCKGLESKLEDWRPEEKYNWANFGEGEEEE